MDKYGLTDGEKEVLKLVVQGLTNAEIANRLLIAVSTVATHLHHIYNKLEVEGAQARIKATIKYFKEI